MQRIHLGLTSEKDKSYDIVIDRGVFANIASDLRMKRFAEKYVVITDKKVGKLYSKKLIDALKREELYLGKIVVPVGESSKSVEQFSECLEDMVGLGANRKTGIIALGGGVVGDLGGYVAASFMRGIEYVHVPTSLLAMVDSSIGGKVGIDLKAGKNLAGAFWHPKKVYIDPDVLRTLPQKHWRAGLGEALKYGAIKERPLWEFFEKHIELWKKKPNDFLPSEWETVSEMIARCAQIKVNVVMKDEREGNVRQILNYGHTFAHVVEHMSDYEVVHGEAVAVGMRMAAALAVEMRFMPQTEYDRQNDLLDALGLGKTKTKGLIKDFVKHMRKDKKAKGDLRVVLVSRLGTCYQQMGQFGIAVEEKIVKKVIEQGEWVDDVEVVDMSQPSSSFQPQTVSSVEQKRALDDVSSTWDGVTSGSYSPSQSTSTSYGAPLSSTSFVGETDLQKRLREMRERAEAKRQYREQSGGAGGLNSSEGAGLGSGGGFLPG
ncbi:MAG: 3-dehydroquinate synthase [Candidatus Gracilibacteria bacterium]|nr:3-dehydroquinate synthase [Candidatus Gracilibacteria bacterium]